jgi:hypothetical protein
VWCSYNAHTDFWSYITDPAVCDEPVEHSYRSVCDRQIGELVPLFYSQAGRTDITHSSLAKPEQQDRVDRQCDCPGNLGQVSFTAGLSQSSSPGRCNAGPWETTVLVNKLVAGPVLYVKGRTFSFSGASKEDSLSRSEYPSQYCCYMAVMSMVLIGPVTSTQRSFRKKKRHCLQPLVSDTNKHNLFPLFLLPKQWIASSENPAALRPFAST